MDDIEKTKAFRRFSALRHRVKPNVMLVEQAQKKVIEGVMAAAKAAGLLSERDGDGVPFVSAVRGSGIRFSFAGNNLQLQLVHQRERKSAEDFELQYDPISNEFFSLSGEDAVDAVVDRICDILESIHPQQIV